MVGHTTHRLFRRSVFAFFWGAVLSGPLVGPILADNLVPEGALYLTHNKIFRSRFAAALNYRTEDGSFRLGTWNTISMWDCFRFSAGMSLKIPTSKRPSD
jgi:hypothetical protein